MSRSGLNENCLLLSAPNYLRDPLIPIVLAVAGGILSAHYLAFSTRESALAIIPLAIFAFAAKSNWLRKSAGLLAMFFTGALTEAFHRLGPPPTIDATSREIMILEGCVVECRRHRVSDRRARDAVEGRLRARGVAHGQTPFLAPSASFASCSANVVANASVPDWFTSVK